MSTVQEDGRCAYDMALLPYKMAQKIVVTSTGCWEWTGGRDPEENTCIMPGDKRKCRRCHTELMRRRRLEMGMTPQTRLEARGECRNGHPVTPESILINNRGRSICRACRSESNRRTKAARKAAQS